MYFYMVYSYNYNYLYNLQVTQNSPFGNSYVVIYFIGDAFAKIVYGI